MKLMKVAVIGLGSMGMGIAKSLVAKGFAVAGVDPEVSRRQEFERAGGQSFSQADRAATGADAAVVAVVNAAQTNTALFDENGAIAQIKPAGCVISCATMAPSDARSLAARCAEAGIHYLDAPLSGGAAKARSGELTIMASGSAEAFAAARPVLDAMATAVYELGDQPGQGSAFKIVNQLLAGIHIAAACEAIAFAKKLELDIDRVYDVITRSAGNSWMFENRVPHILSGDYTPLSAVNIFTKDLGIVSDIARQATFPLPMATSALQLFLMTAAAGMGGDDDASVARLYAQISGIQLPQGEAEPS